MSQSHKAIAATAIGVIEEITVPTRRPNLDEVLIRVDYAATIPYDAYQVDRGLHIQEYPQVLGSSVTGKVVEVGCDVRDLKVGDRVAALTFGDSTSRALQEYVLCPWFFIGKLPETYSLVDAAAIPDNFATAYWTLFGPHRQLERPSTFPSTSTPTDAEEPILVYGASSSAGQYIVQLLKLSGYSNIIATGSPNNHSLLKKLGVRHVINYRSVDVVKDILEKAGKKLSLVIDIIAASSTLDVIAKVLAPGGKVTILLPVKEGNSVMNSVEKEMVMGIPVHVKALFAKQEIIPVSTLDFLSDDWVKMNLMPNLFTQVLESGALEPNPIRLLREGSFKERVLAGLDLFRGNKVSGEKVIIEVNDFRSQYL